MMALGEEIQGSSLIKTAIQDMRDNTERRIVPNGHREGCSLTVTF